PATQQTRKLVRSYCCSLCLLKDQKTFAQQCCYSWSGSPILCAPSAFGGPQRRMACSDPSSRVGFLFFFCIAFSWSGLGAVKASWTGGSRRRGGPSWTTEDLLDGAGRRRQLGGEGTPVLESLMQHPAAGLEQHNQRGAGFEPYADNGGTVVAVAGRDFCIIAADSRLSDGYSILTRDVTRVHRLSGDTHLATAGCWADTQGLLRLLEYLIRGYESQQRRTMGVKAMSHMLSTHLYYRRSFPFYTFNILGGLDDEGTGAVYGYDAVGSFERVRVACAGGGQS
ncbi:unnamed protein product, partial [Laminaria digitata]